MASIQRRGNHREWVVDESRIPDDADGRVFTHAFVGQKLTDFQWTGDGHRFVCNGQHYYMPDTPEALIASCHITRLVAADPQEGK